MSVVVAVAVALTGLGLWVLQDRPDAAVPSMGKPGASPSRPPETSRSADPDPEPRGRPVATCAADPVQGRVPARFWGMHSSAPIGSDFPEAPVRAVNLTTAQVYWNQVETAPGQYDFTRLDQIVATSRERGARPMLVLGFTPAFHATNPTSATAQATMPDLDAWRAWLSAVVSRYGAGLDYQVWPEPNIVSNWEGSPEQMARLSIVAGEVIHARAPEALVVAPATTLRLRSQQRWMDRFWAARVGGTPVAEALDAVALDPFPLEEGTPEDSAELVCRALEILADHDVDLPVWTNEINYGVPSGGPSTGVAPYADERQAAVVARTYILHAALGMERVYWLGWFSYPGLAVEMSRDGVTTPAGEAFIRVHQWLAGGSVPDCRVVRGTHTCSTTRGGVATVVRWRERGQVVVTADGRSRLMELDGDRRTLSRGDRVTVGMAPVAVVGRG